MVESLNQGLKLVAWSAQYMSQGTIVVEDAAVALNGVHVGIIKRLYLHADALQKAVAL